MAKEIERFVPCPKCGLKAVQVETFPNGDFIAVHGYTFKEVQATATGELVLCEVPTRMCVSR